TIDVGALMSAAAQKAQCLITGAAGVIGSRVADAVLQRAELRVRCLVRRPSRIEGLRTGLERWGAVDRVEWTEGDLLYREDCRRAVEGVEVIYHLAAGVEKSFAGAFMNSAVATRNLLDAAVAGGALKRFVNVSSFAVYSAAGLKPD